jgi:hypothetical protein
MNAVSFYSLPEYVRSILSTFEESENPNYVECERMNEELKAIDWDCDYDLSGDILYVLPLYVVDNDGVKWTRQTDTASDTFYWKADFLPETVTVYCTPFYEDMNGIPFEILTDMGDSSYTFTPLTEESNMLEELKKLFTTVKTRI